MKNLFETDKQPQTNLNELILKEKISFERQRYFVLNTSLLG